jgi:hypothetical protein
MYTPDMSVLKFVAHSRLVLTLAAKRGWLPAARYTNLRDVRGYERLGFLDIDWRGYSFGRHISAAKATYPIMTVACDIERRDQIPRVLDQAEELSQYAEYVVVVPKLAYLGVHLDLIPARYILGYSVPTRYGMTNLPARAFRGRSVHLLGGRPDHQRLLASELEVVSMDCNRFTLDARYGDYFDGERFRTHPHGGYRRCLADSLKQIDILWDSYRVTRPLEVRNGNGKRSGS